MQQQWFRGAVFVAVFVAEECYLEVGAGEFEGGDVSVGKVEGGCAEGAADEGYREGEALATLGWRRRRRRRAVYRRRRSLRSLRREVNEEEPWNEGGWVEGRGGTDAGHGEREGVRSGGHCWQEN